MVNPRFNFDTGICKAFATMIIGFRLQQEFKFLRASHATLWALGLLLAMSSISVVLGLQYVAEERKEIAELLQLDSEERGYKRTLAMDFGGAAYDAFHAVWNEPSELAFAAIGQRDLNPTMMRIRALALEGQIYETDSINPELALVGRFDYAFVTAYLLPLVIIFLFYDLVSSERESGRFNLLSVSSTSAAMLWLPRVLIRLLGLLIALLIPLWFGMLAEGTGLGLFARATGAVIFQAVFWAATVLLIGSRSSLRSESIAALCVMVWITLTLAIPISGKVLIERSISGVKGSEVSLVQREAVNDAWDLPKSSTMEQFYESHPEWSDSSPLGDDFHWKWYYAFQQVGDETAAELAGEYRKAILARDQSTARIAWLSPAVAIQRRLEELASTNVMASLKFEDQVRHYHEIIRRAYYPVLFRDVPFSDERLAQVSIPDFAEAVRVYSD